MQSLNDIIWGDNKNTTDIKDSERKQVQQFP